MENISRDLQGSEILSQTYGSMTSFIRLDFSSCGKKEIRITVNIPTDSKSQHAQPCLKPAWMRNSTILLWLKTSKYYLRVPRSNWIRKLKLHIKLIRKFKTVFKGQICFYFFYLLYLKITVQNLFFQIKYVIMPQITDTLDDHHVKSTDM